MAASTRSSAPLGVLSEDDEDRCDEDVKELTATQNRVTIVSFCPYLSDSRHMTNLFFLSWPSEEAAARR